MRQLASLIAEIGNIFVLNKLLLQRRDTVDTIYNTDASFEVLESMQRILPDCGIIWIRVFSRVDVCQAREPWLNAFACVDRHSKVVDAF